MPSVRPGKDLPACIGPLRMKVQLDGMASLDDLSGPRPSEKHALKFLASALEAKSSKKVKVVCAAQEGAGHYRRAADLRRHGPTRP